MRGLAAMLVCTAVVGGAATIDAGGGQERRRTQTAPETFTSPMQARTELGAASATVRIQIDRYTPDAERTKITDALRYGGYPGFLVALRKAPAVGHVAIGDLQVPLRWAREQETPKGRAISLVTETPLYFIGSGRPEAKPRVGFEVAIVQLAVDEFGLGTGTMAAAARIKSDGEGGVVMEDYAEEPIRLTSVYRVIK
jgi:hypothetical protein